MAYIKLLSILAFVALVQGHMEMSFPAPFRSKFNPNAVNIDYTNTAPLMASGANFPCKGYQSDLGTAAGASVVTWNQGAAVNITIVGGAAHNGGSCQVSLSYDSGKSFTVIHSFIGGCPLTTNWNFNVPSDAPKGAALFAWTWFNEVGNREMYMNCASITIAGGSAKKRASTTAFSSRPDIFTANIGNGCTTVETQDVVFPNPGPDVTGTSSKSGTGFTGNCGGSSGAASGSVGEGAPAASSPASKAPEASSPPVASSATTAITIIPVTSSASASGFVTSTTGTAPSSSAPVVATGTGSAPAATGSLTPPGGVKMTADGQCSGTQTCAGSTFGQCCSQWGWCGVTSQHCGSGCMEAFSGSGACGASSNSTTTVAARVRALKARGFSA